MTGAAEIDMAWHHVIVFAVKTETFETEHE